MNTRCKPGDLAYIVWSAIPENIGKVVEVIRVDDSIAPKDATPGSLRWVIRTRTQGFAIDRITGVVCAFAAGAETSTYDYALRPISGVPIDEETNEDVKEPA